MHLNKTIIALSFPYPPLLLVYMYYLNTLIEVGDDNCGRCSEIRPDLLSTNRKSWKKTLVFNNSRNFGPVSFETYVPEKKSACQFGPVGFEIHLPESRIHLPWQAGKCEGNTLRLGLQLVACYTKIMLYFTGLP
jgi:hypothetical protein